MADWVTGKVTKVQFWTDALFSLTVHAPVHPFKAGQFAKLGLDVDGTGGRGDGGRGHRAVPVGAVDIAARNAWPRSH